MDNAIDRKLLFSLLFGIIGVILFLFFRKRNFFSLKDLPETDIPGFYPLLTFLIYLLSIFLMQKIAASIASAEGVQTIRMIALLEASRLGILSLIFAWVFKRSPRKYQSAIWKRAPSSFMKDLIYVAIYFSVVFPLSISLYQLLETFVYFIFQIETIPDQLVVQFVQMSIPYPLSLALLSIAIVALAPFVEESLFRGFLLTWLRGKIGAKGAILISAICFTLFHYSPVQAFGNIPILGSLFILALFLGIIYEKRGSLLAPIFLHSLFNAISLLQILWYRDI